MSKKTCAICENNITKINNEIICVYCDYACCKNCVKKFITNNSSNCMKCNKEWNEEYMLDIFPINYIKNNKDYVKKKKNDLFTIQQSMFQETFVHIENDKKRTALYKEIRDCKQKIINLQERIDEIGRVEKNNVIQKTLIIKQCPSEKCNGYLNEKYECPICDIIVCEKCEQQSDEYHICNDDDAKTVEMKKKECKNCPTCGRITFKDGGCYQTWCPPPCNGGKGTAWDYNTGEIDKGTIHAPLYYAYIRENRINNDDDEMICLNDGQLVDIHMISRVLRNKDFRIKEKYLNQIYKIHRVLIHIKRTVMPKYYVVEETFDTNLNIRKNYLKTNISNDDFIIYLWKQYNANRKKRLIYQNLEMIYNVCVDIYLKLYVNICSKQYGYFDFKIYILELNTIREYYNESIIKTKNKLDIKGLDIEFIDEEWDIGRCHVVEVL